MGIAQRTSDTGSVLARAKGPDLEGAQVGENYRPGTRYSPPRAARVRTGLTRPGLPIRLALVDCVGIDNLAREEGQQHSDKGGGQGFVRSLFRWEALFPCGIDRIRPPKAR